MSDRIRPYERAQSGSREEYFKIGWQSSDSLCQIMQRRCEESGYPAQAPRRSLGELAAWVGFPWLTLILGSGCLEAPSDAEELAVRLGRGVRRSLERTLGENDTWALDLTTRFAVSLAEDRLLAGRLPQPSREGHPAGTIAENDEAADAEEVTKLAASVCYAAAIATFVFHEMGRVAGQAMSRRSNDIIVLGAGAGTQGLSDDIGRARKALDDAYQEVTDHERTRIPLNLAVGTLLTELNYELDTHGGQRIASAYRIRLLTEVAWHFLVTSTGVYPGWTDLLLRLMLSEGSPAQRRSARHPRPRYDSLDELLRVAKRIMAAPTEASWEVAGSGSEAPAGARQGLYRQAAQVLWAQAESHQECAQLPPASVFVTTFDLEMEMALAATGDGRKFSVAVPVYVREDVDALDAQFCWLLGDIDPAAHDEPLTLDTLKHPVGWRVLGASTLPAHLQGRPIVVHLCGAPLIEPPEMTPELSDEFKFHGVSIQDTTLLTPAITVDEYLAMRQSEVELSWLSRDTLDSHAAPGRALPPALTVSGKRGFGIRYWLAMGVPISDPAVRNRVLAQIGAARSVLRAGEAASAQASSGASSTSYGGLVPSPASAREDEPTPSRADIFGAAVNLYIDDDEVALLHWLGLDVVEDSCHSFRTDLEHYIAHLTAPPATKRAPRHARCPLGSES